jgi:hypothetical protein
VVFFAGFAPLREVIPLSVFVGRLLVRPQPTTWVF